MHVDGAEALDYAVQHEAGGLTHCIDDLGVACFEADQHVGDLPCYLRVGLHHLVGLAVERHQPVVRLIALDRVHLGRVDVLQAPRQEHDLLADVVDQILSGDVVPAGPHASGESVPDDRVASSADMDRPGGIDGCVLQQHLLRPVLAPAVAGCLFQNGAHGGGCQHGGVDLEVQIAILGPGPGDQGHGGQMAQRLLGDGGRRLAQRLGQREARHREIGDAGGWHLDLERHVRSHGAERLLCCTLHLRTERSQRVHYIAPVEYLSMAATPPKAFISISPSSESTDSSSTVVPTLPASS